MAGPPVIHDRAWSVAEYGLKYTAVRFIRLFTFAHSQNIGYYESW
jgi:hypothetical protein